MRGTDGDGGGLLAAAGVLFLDGSGRLLVVRLPYDRKHPIAIPGGGWEPADGSPRATAVREIREELGVTPELGPLACVDWSLDPVRPPIAALLYWAAPLRPEQLAALRPQAEEVGWWGFLPADRAASALPPKLSRRVTACLTAPRTAAPLELEDSLPAGHSLAHLPRHSPAPPYTRTAGLGLPPGGGPPERRPPLEHSAYLAGLPRIRAEVRLVCTDPDGRVLLLPARAARAGWTLPGGVVRADRELPRETARRELAALGAERSPGRLLGLDWRPADDGPARLVYVFDGGAVPEVRPGPADPRLCAPAEVHTLLLEPDQATLHACLTARAAGGAPVELVRGVRPEGAGPSTRGESGTT
ncbi:NUDIX hydrolase [Kitasatospora kazusensis]|uniref:NUDIX hydrolase n=1 Tax=Kitasatospora kazusensis TaxID=407974 RepID=UPI0031D22D4D